MSFSALKKCMHYIYKYNYRMDSVCATNIKPFREVFAIQFRACPPIAGIGAVFLWRKKQISSLEYSVSPWPLIWHCRLANSVNYFLQYGGVLMPSGPCLKHSARR